METAKTQQHTGVAGVNGDAPFVRFNVGQRVEHFLLMIAFTGLVITGLPQKFYGVDLSSDLVTLMGGIEFTRSLHRFFAVVFTIESVFHFVYITQRVLRRKARPSMIPTVKDVRDSFTMLRYSLGVSQQLPKYDRYDYRQKFEYWGVVLGALIMIATGLVLWFPTYFTFALPGELVPASKEMHGGEALLAFLVIVVWHLYSVHLSPVQFPGDSSIFTGTVPVRKMLHEHPLEYARATGIPIVDDEGSHEPVRAPDAVATATEQPQE